MPAVSAWIAGTNKLLSIGSRDWKDKCSVWQVPAQLTSVISEKLACSKNGGIPMMFALTGSGPFPNTFRDLRLVGSWGRFNVPAVLPIDSVCSEIGRSGQLTVVVPLTPENTLRTFNESKYCIPFRSRVSYSTGKANAS